MQSNLETSLVTLTARELEVLTLKVREGMSHKEVADALYISERTVGFHLANVYDKTGERTVNKAYRYCLHLGLLEAK